jgi:superfamily II helicase
VYKRQASYLSSQLPDLAVEAYYGSLPRTIKDKIHTQLQHNLLDCIVTTSAMAQGVDIAGFTHVFIDGLPFSLSDMV